jgi:hypothetical protein
MPRISLLRLMFSFSACAAPAEDSADTATPLPPHAWVDGDRDGFGDPDAPAFESPRPAGTVGNDRDCDDHDPDTWPGSSEVSNGRDDDCDGEVDEDLGRSASRAAAGSLFFSTDAPPPPGLLRRHRPGDRRRRDL